MVAGTSLQPYRLTIGRLRNSSPLATCLEQFTRMGHLPIKIYQTEVERARKAQQ